MPAFCTFCNQSGTPTDDEHLIPKWMTRLYPDTVWIIEDELTKYTRPSTKNIHLVAPWCKPCNNGWMSQLEERAAPILKPLIAGIRTILSPHDQQILKEWFCLRAMVNDKLAADKRGLRPRYFKDEEHFQLATTRTCYPYYEFFLARYSPEKGKQGLTREDHFDTSFFRTDTKQFVGNVTRAHSFTLVFECLVLQILCIKSPEPLIRKIPNTNEYRFQFGEPFPISSYPPFPITNNTLDDFAYFWSKYVKMPSGLISETP